VAARTLEHLDHADCESACYRCLKSYNNQRHHEHLSWPNILPELEQLAAEPPKLTDQETYDPKPWLDAYAAGVGSPLELRFLRIFEANGIDVEKQVPVAPSDADKPISVADFVIKGSRTAVYVDGAVFHRGERLRRDRLIRQQLQGSDSPWTIVTLTARDLNGHSDALASVVGNNYILPSKVTHATEESNPPNTTAPPPTSAHESIDAGSDDGDDGFAGVQISRGQAMCRLA
jgi:hypothetical protein